ncbi:ParA family protein [Gallibacterium melopsittaci]|uniref:ParA family protein n=1 Tax=Gallibacterium melopsittaci TaxID=516063 RepID=A0ABV6HZT7_9PAST
MPNAANISAFCADHGLKVLMIDTDVQPSLSSYYQLNYSAKGGIYEFLIDKNTNPTDIISHTNIKNLHLIKSNDPTGKISFLLRNSPDGVIRFNYLLQQIHGYDLIIIDTRGTRDITLEMSVLASDLIISPLLPELLSTREFLRGTLSLYSDLHTYSTFGLQLPPIKAIANRVDNTNDAKDIIAQLRQIFNEPQFKQNYQIELLDLVIPSRVAYREANTLCIPIHRYKKTEHNTMKKLCSVLFPQFQHLFN